MKTWNFTRFCIVTLFLGACSNQSSNTQYVRSLSKVSDSPNEYLVGQGIGDITGPAFGATMIGYVKMKQVAEGMHTRLWSRAFVIADATNSKRVAIVNTDLLGVVDGLKRGVLDSLNERLGPVFNDGNLMIGATHSHNGPGGYSHYGLYNIFNQGMNSKHYDTIVKGIADSVADAYARLAPGKIGLANGMLLNANVNRSPNAYLENPAEERARYTHDTDVEMSQLNFFKGSEAIGVFNWFPAHAVSIEADNHLVSGDNKGLAALLLEKEHGTDYLKRTGFVAGFGNANAGDASPNTSGDLDGDRDWDCQSTDNFACAEESAGKHLDMSKSLMERSQEFLAGPIDYRVRYVDMASTSIDPQLSGGKSAKTCIAAYGFGLIAGATEDGPGIGQIAEGWPCSRMTGVLKALCKVDPCQGQKPVILQMGKPKTPLSPHVMPVQILRIGQIAIVGLPGEFTTMSGRRIREAVAEKLSSVGVTQVIVAGYTNSYAGYVVTQEEYQPQYYEGTSTHFGEWTHAAYQQSFVAVAEEMRSGIVRFAGVPRGDLPSVNMSRTRVAADRLPNRVSFGQVSEQPREKYGLGEVATAKFWGAKLSNNYMNGSSFLRVQKREGDSWKDVAFDWDHETRLFIDHRLGTSQISVEWHIPTGTAAGVYRITHDGYSADGSEQLRPYHGESREFTVQ